MFVNLVLWTATLSGSTTNYAPANKSEEASAEDFGSDNFYRNRFPGTTVKIGKLGVLLCQCRWCLKVFFLCSLKVNYRYDKLAETFSGFVCLAVLLTFRAQT